MLYSAGSEVRDRGDANSTAWFTAIRYHDEVQKFVFAAKHWYDPVTSYICQLPQGLTYMLFIYVCISFNMNIEISCGRIMQSSLLKPVIR